MNTTGKLYSGTSGLLLPVKNKKAFPPEFSDKSRLTYYASLFSSIEINSSFYKIPRATTVANWTQSVPQNFRFTFKLWRGITHNKGLVFDTADVINFMSAISEVGGKSGCLLVQFPPGNKVGNIGQLEKLLACISETSQSDQWKVAVEVRDRSWYRDDVYDLMHEYGAALVVQDMPASVTPHREPMEKFAYLRFHGPGGSYRGSYDKNVLYEHAGYVKEWLADGVFVYAYFNNTMGDAIKNLRDLRAYVQE